MAAEYLAKTQGVKITKSLRKQIKSVDYTPFSWIDNEADLATAVGEIEYDLAQGCNVLAVDLEYHCVERHASILCLLQLSTASKDYIFDSLLLRDKI